ncbi:alpha/beta fold hydrolase [Conexibacter sp. SYSU D00693]|uniref:alpha/beta fold hydrolase n=1 Tax=Conexibacter sp. SYSU D00693 TaxID=2812560 RepID=UPI001F120012|nr:hypothetical protein [Conexibacter sp. SYSU D00693]
MADHLAADLLVHVSAMVPVPGERFMAWWSATGHEASGHAPLDDELAAYMHDVDPELARQALARAQPEFHAPEEPWPLVAQPDVPTRFVLCTEDRFFPAAWMREVVRRRLGVEPDELEASHSPYLSRPAELAGRLDGYVAQPAAASGRGTGSG